MQFTEEEITLGQVAHAEHSRLLENRGLLVLSWENLERWQRDEWIQIALAVRNEVLDLQFKDRTARMLSDATAKPE